MTAGGAPRASDDSGSTVVERTCIRAGTNAGSEADGHLEVFAGMESAGVEESTSVFTSVSAASFKSGSLAPESIAASFGENLAAATQSGSTISLPTALAGTSVTVAGSAGVARLAALFLVSPSQINYLVPADTGLGQATVGAPIGSRRGTMQDATPQLTRRHLLTAVAAGSATLFIANRPALAQAAPLARAQKEEFLLRAKIVNTHEAPEGITGTPRVTLDDGELIHDASIQTIDEYRQWLQPAPAAEFKRSWKFDVAAYRLDRVLGLNMVPVTVERRYRGSPASFTWWVDDVLMDEGDRIRKKLEAPDTDNWNAQMQIVRVFDQLIFNVDRNLGNLIVDKSWQIWMIDHSRSFRILLTFREPKNLERCDEDLLEKLMQLNTELLQKELGKYLATPEIKGLLARRDRIVKAFEEKGPSALYKSQRRPD